VLYDPAVTGALARAIEELAGDATLRGRLGLAARTRVEREFSWAAHCKRLDAAIRSAVRQRRS
jgi:glycosyltransferase involved in cell wall biosynthesis